MTPHPQIASAIKAVGSQPKLAELAGLSQQHISKLLRRQRGVSAEAAVAIERATRGKVPRHVLRPDLWPTPSHEAA